MIVADIFVWALWTCGVVVTIVMWSLSRHDVVWAVGMDSKSLEVPRGTYAVAVRAGG